MSQTTVENIVIVGTGCAGLTAAVYTARANLNPLVLEGSQPGGQLTTTSEVENFPGFPEGVDGFQLMENLRKQATKFGTRFEQTLVRSVDFTSSPRKLICDDRNIYAHSVISATGAAPRMTGIPGERELFGGKGVTTCATCDGAFYRKMDVAVIGGGDSAAEEALFLTRFASKVYLVHRRDSLRASKIMADRATSHPKIEMVWNSVPTEVIGVAESSVSGLKVKNAVTGEESASRKGAFSWRSGISPIPVLLPPPSRWTAKAISSRRRAHRCKPTFPEYTLPGTAPITSIAKRSLQREWDAKRR